MSLVLFLMYKVIRWCYTMYERINDSVPDRASGNRLDPEILGTDPEIVCDGEEGVQAKPDLALPEAKNDGSRDLAAMEET
jgi:hypothetical protein